MGDSKRAAEERARRRSKRLSEPLTITSDLVVSPTVEGWERELLLPVIVALVERLWATAEKGDETKKDA